MTCEEKEKVEGFIFAQSCELGTAKSWWGGMLWLGCRAASADFEIRDN